MWTLARIAGHSGIVMSARYVHPGEVAVLDALDKLAARNGTPDSALPAAPIALPALTKQA